VDEPKQDNKGLLEETREADVSLSNLDEALSDGASLCCDKTPFTGSPILQDLVGLGQEHGRMSCNIRNKDGARTPSVELRKTSKPRSKRKPGVVRKNWRS
jgi:hypothetical protein